MTPCNSKLYLGLDVAKASLALYWQETSYTIANTEAALEDFITQHLRGVQAEVFCVLEATGGYERLASACLQRAGVRVHVGHPNRIHAFAKACGHFAKTDKLDAILLAKYAAFIADTEEEAVPLDAAYQDIIALRRLARSVELTLHKAQCQSQQLPKVCHKYLQKIIAFCTKQSAALEAEIDQRITNHAELKAKRQLMVTMKGMGAKTAAILLAELPELGTLTSKQAASLTGLAPRLYQSGKKAFGGSIANGRFFARKALYMVALVATQHDPHIKARYLQLQAKNKAKKVALVAIMRRQIVTLNAMLKKQQPYKLLA